MAKAIKMLTAIYMSSTCSKDEIEYFNAFYNWIAKHTTMRDSMRRIIAIRDGDDDASSFVVHMAFDVSTTTTKQRQNMKVQIKRLCKSVLENVMIKLTSGTNIANHDGYVRSAFKDSNHVDADTTHGADTSNDMDTDHDHDHDHERERERERDRAVLRCTRSAYATETAATCSQCTRTTGISLDYPINNKGRHVGSRCLACCVATPVKKYCSFELRSVLDLWCATCEAFSATPTDAYVQGTRCSTCDACFCTKCNAYHDTPFTINARCKTPHNINGSRCSPTMLHARQFALNPSPMETR